MARITIRPATRRDLEHLVRHRRAMWEDMGVTEDLDGADAVYRRWARARLASGELKAWLALAGGEVVGGGALWLQPVQPRPGWAKGVTPYLLSMYTEKAWRGKGVAQRIVKAAIRWTRAHGYPRMTLHASDKGRPVYARLGFRATREMQLQLRPEAVMRGARRRKASRAARARPPRRAAARRAPGSRKR